ncbi:sigma-70 family RNA polymerase sigma factor [Chitinophaga lutea]
MTKYSDAALFQRMQADDSAAFTELFHRHHRPLYLTAFRILRQEEAAMDAVQDVFTACWQRRAELAPEYPVAYLQQAVRFQVYRAIRDQKTDALFYDRLLAISPEVLEENPWMYKELHALVQQVIASLPEDSRRIFLLSREEQLTYKEIAGRMDISVKTVEKKMTFALKVLRTRLKDAMFTFLA